MKRDLIWMPVVGHRPLVRDFLVGDERSWAGPLLDKNFTVAVRFPDGTHQYSEINEFCEDTFEEQSYLLTAATYSEFANPHIMVCLLGYFSKPEHAAIFKLRWG